MEEKSYSQLQAKYGGKFVATRGGKVIASAQTLENLFKLMKRKRIEYDRFVTISHIDRKGAICVYRISF